MKLFKNTQWYKSKVGWEEALLRQPFKPTSGIEYLREVNFDESDDDYVVWSRGVLRVFVPHLSKNVPLWKIVPKPGAERKRLKADYIFWRLSH